MGCPWEGGSIPPEQSTTRCLRPRGDEDAARRQGRLYARTRSVSVSFAFAFASTRDSFAALAPPNTRRRSRKLPGQFFEWKEGRPTQSRAHTPWGGKDTRPPARSLHSEKFSQGELEGRPGETTPSIQLNILLASNYLLYIYVYTISVFLSLVHIIKLSTYQFEFLGTLSRVALINYHHFNLDMQSHYQ